jgi:hypothetical protein
MLSKESCAAVLNAGSNLRVSGLPTDALVELARRQSHGCFTPQRGPGEAHAGFGEEGTQAHRGADRNAAADSGKEGQGNCGQAGGKADRAAEKSWIEA